MEDISKLSGPELAERFRSKYRVCEDTGCWLWTAYQHGGYGLIQVCGRPHRAHRLSYQLHVGEITDGLCVCHRCDVRHCVNPGHLFLGTHADNARDKQNKGRCARLCGDRNGSRTKPHRQVRGDRHGMAKLSIDDVASIRARRGTTTQVALAAEYGVSDTTVSKIQSGKLWRHL